MNTQQFLQYINQPALLDQHATKELEQLVAEYPAFHAAQVLLARAYKNLHDHRFEKQLKKAAIHTGDRALLFDYLQEEPIKLETSALPEPVIEKQAVEPPANTEAHIVNIPAAEPEPIAHDPLVLLEGDNLLDASTHIIPEELAKHEDPSAAIELKVYSALPDETSEFILTNLDDEPYTFEQPAYISEITAETNKTGIPDTQEAEITSNIFTEDDERPTYVEEIAAEADDISIPDIREPEITGNTFTENDERPTYVEPEDTFTEDIALTDIPETGLPPLTEMPGQSPSELPAVEPEEEPEEEPGEDPEEDPGEEDTDPLQPSHLELDPETPVIDTMPVAEPVLSSVTRQPIDEFPETHKQGEETSIAEADKASSHDFNWWLNNLKKDNPGHTETTAGSQLTEDSAAESNEHAGTVNPPVTGNDKKDTTLKIIDRFLEDLPSISKPQAEFFKPANMARQSEQFDPDWVTETLAKVYARQGNIQKAIAIYQKLILQFPDKKSYFASRIAELKNKN